MKNNRQSGALRIFLTLAGVCLIAGLALGGAYMITRDRIAYQQEQEKQKALIELFGDREISEEKVLDTPEKPIIYWEVLQEGTVEGYAIKGEEYGYSSLISFIAAVNPSFEIRGIVILSQNETPGLGTRIAEVPVSRYIFGMKKEVEITSPWFLEQFTGLNPLETIRVKKIPEWHTLGREERAELRKTNEVTSVTGATISSEAVSKGVNTTVRLFQTYYSEKEQN